MDAIRMMLTFALLVVVWRHSYWSVALSLTLLAVGAEAATIILKHLMKKSMEGAEK